MTRQSRGQATSYRCTDSDNSRKLRHQSSTAVPRRRQGSGDGGLRTRCHLEAVPGGARAVPVRAGPRRLALRGSALAAAARAQVCASSPHTLSAVQAAAECAGELGTARTSRSPAEGWAVLVTLLQNVVRTTRAAGCCRLSRIQRNRWVRFQPWMLRVMADAQTP